METADKDGGYFTDIEYTVGYYREMAPQQIDFMMLLSGYEPPARAGMRYLELGFGHGLSLNIHAAGTPGEYWGTDFLPSQTARAQAMADVSGASVKLFSDSFADFAARENVPKFDYITLHGIWSWVSEENRDIITTIAERHLKPGGVFWISYNALPGWSSNEPLRQLIALHEKTLRDTVPDVTRRLNAAVRFANQIAEADAWYFKHNPRAQALLELMAKMDRVYMAHEYLNEGWAAVYSFQVHRKLARAGLTFAGSSTPLDHAEALNLTAPQRSMLARIADPTLRETIRSYFVNEQFRRDIMTRGARRLSMDEVKERLLDLRLILTVILPEGSLDGLVLKVRAPIGEIYLDKKIYLPVLSYLREDGYKPKRIGDILKLPALAGMGAKELIEMVGMLSQTAQVMPVQMDADIAAARPHCDKLNEHAMIADQGSGGFIRFASPVTGTGIPLTKLDRAFITAHRRGAVSISDLTQEGMARQAQGNQEEAKLGEPDVEKMAAYFMARLPVLRQLEILS